MKAVLIVPALNEATVVGELVRRVPRDVVDEVIVVDNGVKLHLLIGVCFGVEPMNVSVEKL